MKSKRLTKLNFADLQAAASRPASFRQTHSGRGPWVQCFSPDGFVWKTVELPIAHLPAGLVGLRILHLTDLHMRGYWGRGYDELLTRVRAAAPDLIVITGDFVQSKVDPRPALPHLARLISGLPATLGIYGILGNHDSDHLTPYLINMGVKMIGRRRVIVSANTGELELIGLPGIWRSDYDREFVRAQPPKADGVPRIVLCHFPDLFPAARNLEPDLYLAGHTHGGQICLPNGYAPLTHDRMPREFCKGIHQIGRTWFIVNQGLGFSGPPIRIFCPAEVIELKLARG